MQLSVHLKTTAAPRQIKGTSSVRFTPANSFCAMCSSSQRHATLVTCVIRWFKTSFFAAYVTRSRAGLLRKNDLTQKIAVEFCNVAELAMLHDRTLENGGNAQHASNKVNVHWINKKPEMFEIGANPGWCRCCEEYMNPEDARHGAGLKICGEKKKYLRLMLQMRGMQSKQQKTQQRLRHSNCAK